MLGRLRDGVRAGGPVPAAPPTSPNARTDHLAAARPAGAGADEADAGGDHVLEVRRVAADAGALVTVAQMDLVLADIALEPFDRDGCRDAAQRCVDASRRYGLASLPVALLWLAGAHALAGSRGRDGGRAGRGRRRGSGRPAGPGRRVGPRPRDVPRVRDDRDALAPGPRHDDGVHPRRAGRRSRSSRGRYCGRCCARCTTTTSACRPGPSRRRRGWSGAGSVSRCSPWSTPWRSVGAAAAPRRAAAVERGLARAVGGPRTGRGTPCVSSAEAAIRDGWGDPAGWLREAEAFFADRGYDRIARDAGRCSPRPALR